MDESPEELAQIRRDAARIDVNRYRRRFRVLAAVGLGALGAGVVFLVLEMVDGRRNPCQRLRHHLCATGAAAQCAMYQDVVAESEQRGNREMRRNLRAQCLSKITRLKDEDGVTVP